MNTGTTNANSTTAAPRRFFRNDPQIRFTFPDFSVKGLVEYASCVAAVVGLHEGSSNRIEVISRMTASQTNMFIHAKYAIVPMASGIPYGSSSMELLRSAAIVDSCSGSLIVRISFTINQN